MRTSASIVKNVLIAVGAYYVSWWVAPLIAVALWKVTERIVYRGNFEAAVFMPLVQSLPFALMAAVVGATVAMLVESKQPLFWVALPAALYAFSFQDWVLTAGKPFRIASVIVALFPAASCFVGAVVALRWRGRSARASSS
jgi:hypothetical protein